MATADQVVAVRVNTNELGRDTFSDDLIGSVVDSLGSVAAASSEIWNRKAATFSEMVDVSEAGASRKMSDLYKNAIAMSDRFSKMIPGADTEVANGKRAKVFKIERS